MAERGSFFALCQLIGELRPGLPGALARGRLAEAYLRSRGPAAPLGRLVLDREAVGRFLDDLLGDDKEAPWSS